MEERPSLVSGPIWTLEDLNAEGSAIQGDAHFCMKQCAPPSATITKIYSIDWWSSKIDSLNRKLKTIRHYLRKWHYRRLNRNLPDHDSNKMKYTFEDLKLVRRSFKKACRKAKKTLAQDC